MGLIKRDIAQEITNIIIEKLEQGTAPWKRSWKCNISAMRPLRANGESYTGINSIFLWAVADSYEYGSRYWMTAKQAEKLGGRVDNIRKSWPSVYFNCFKKTQQHAVTGETFDRFIAFMRHYEVYNADQIIGLPVHYYAERKPDIPLDPSERQAAIDAFFDPIPIKVKHGGNRAYYSIGGDHVQMPRKSAFKSSDHYTAVLAHEFTHATGAAHRLGRRFGKKFGDKAYAFEELIAEIGSGLITSELELPHELHDSHASYVASWLKILKKDKSAIITAAAKAEQAFRYLAEFSGYDVNARHTARQLETL